MISSFPRRSLNKVLQNKTIFCCREFFFSFLLPWKGSLVLLLATHLIAEGIKPPPVSMTTRTRSLKSPYSIMSDDSARDKKVCPMTMRSLNKRNNKSNRFRSLSDSYHRLLMKWGNPQAGRHTTTSREFSPKGVISSAHQERKKFSAGLPGQRSNTIHIFTWWLYCWARANGGPAATWFTVMDLEDER